MRKLLFSLMLLVTLFTTQVAMAQAPEATPEEAIKGLLTRIGGSSAPDKFEIVIDANLAENGKDVFIITAQNGKPCIKGNNQLSVATGINWYLNHYAHINLTWNNLTTDLSAVTLPVPEDDEKHVCSATYRYDFNTCTFSYSMAFWTWDRWQKEIDWMALHGINAPLNLVGLEVVTRKFLEELGVSESDIDAYIAGPGFMAWFAMNNLEGWGGTVNATDVTMNGNPDWWYTRQEQLCKNMLQRMRELGMQPVIPGFSGQIPNSLSNYTITGFSTGDVINGGSWAGGYTRPDILHPDSPSYATLASIYYKHLEAVMGVSEFYSMDPFHEGGLPDAVTNATCYPPIMAALDTYHNAVEDATKTKYNVSTDDNQAKWIIQYWQNIPQSGAFSSMESYGDRFIGLDLFSDNIYAGNAAKWRDAGSDCYYKGRPYLYCMLHNFGGRSGMHGRLETTMNGYFEALAKGNNCQGIGATPEGTETNPILYDMLFELPWMDVDNRPTADDWLKDYAYARYGIDNEKALSALSLLKNSVWNCQRNQQGTSEAIILGRPRWTFGDAERNDGVSLEGRSVSSWSKSSIYWDTQDVRLAADELISISDLVTTTDGVANYDYDVIEVVRQSMCDLAYEILPLINSARSSGNTAEYYRLYNLFLQLMLDLDEMLSYDENFKLERWTSLARNIAGEVDGTTVNDRNWLEWNARTQVTVWSKGNNGLNDYSNRCWASLIKDFHYPRWKYFFENNGAIKDGNWYTSEYAWTVNYTNYDYSTVTIPEDMTATEKAVETFGMYFGRVVSATKKYIFPMGVATNATKSDVIPEVYRGQTVTLPLTIGKSVTISSVQIDLNGDGAMGNGETLTATDMNVEIPADATVGKTKAIVTFSDGTVITFNLAIIVDITADRTVTATADASMGSVAIEGDDDADGSITNKEAVKITATAITGYNFKDWTDAQGNVVSNDNPYIYYGETDASFTANFIQDKWGVVECNGTLSGDIAGYKQFIHNLTFAYYNRDAETIFETTTAPTQIFNTIPQIVNVPRGASFTVKYDNGDSDGLQYCYFRAFIDFNADGDFDDEGELLKEVGTNGATNTAVCSNTINVLLPYDAPLGITHMRLRFDGAWDNNNNPSGRGAKDASIRPVYEIVLNITEGSNKAAHITVESNNPEWGTAEVWTEETPGWTASNEWDVSADTYVNVKATPATADVEFLGWYDHYGRLLTTDLKYSMLAKEDATYTARFRKFLEIDGWQIEYRTQSGDVAKTNKLANGVKPENGKTYYIYAPTRPTNDGDYVNRYLLNNNGTLTATTDAPTGDYYYWTCSVDGENYTFQNVGDPTKYLAYKVVAESPYNFSLGTGTTYYEGITIYAVNDSRFIVINDKGDGFNHSTKAHNQSTEDYTTDFVFTEVSYPDEIILTKVRQSGNNDLVIPETVEVLGEQCTIVGFDNGLFNNNKDLWSVTLPQSMEFLSVKSLVSGTMTGTVESGTGTVNSQYYTVYNLDKALVASEGFEVTVKGTSDGSTYNQWGSGLFASGTDPLATTYSGGFQFYLGSGGNFVLKVNGSAEEALDNSNCKVVAGTPFTATIRYENGTLTINVDNGAGQTGAYTKTCTINDISAFSAAIPKGITLNVNVESLSGEEANPFEGCSNLDAIAIDGTCENYYVNDSDGGLYNSSDYLVCLPAGKEKGADRRALATLIEQMKELTAQVATFNPTGKTTETSLSTTQGAGYIWCNAPQSGSSVGELLDNKAGTFFHSNWGSTTAPSDGLDHHLTVELGDGNGLSQFKFHYQARSGSGLGDYPKTIKVEGSNDGKQFDDIATVEPRNANGGTIENGAEWTSEVLGNGNAYTYLRFMVTATTTNKNKDGHIYWHMAEFDLYKVSASADVFPIFEGTKLTDDFAAARYDVLLDAINVYENGTTAQQMQDAKNDLQTAYDDLLAKFNSVLPVKLTIDEENPVLYKIFIQRTADVTVLQYDEESKMVAVANKADDKSYQAWYFMNSANGFMILPYNGDGKVLSADNTGNDPAKVWAVKKGEKSYYEWKFVARTNDYYNIQVHDGSNYFSNYGGTTNKMGFWSGDPDTDGGSLFKFVEAEFGEDNARFYQLSDVKATMTDGTNIYGGTSVGLYTGGKEYREAYTAATTLVTAGNSSASDECHTAYKALREAKENLAYNAPDAEKVYYIKSVSTNAYCKDKYVYTNTKSVSRTCWAGTISKNHTNLLFDAKSDIEQLSLAAFRFEETGTQGAYKMKNLHTNMYVKSFEDEQMTGTAGDAQNVTIAGIADGQVTLRIGNSDPMHAQEDYGVIVDWEAAVDNASVWTIDEVANESDLNYTTTMSQLGYGTLMLGYDVKVPAGITANVAREVSGKYIIFESVDDVIPANTAVILKSNDALSESVTLTFEYAGNSAAALADDENILNGSLYDTTIDGVNNKIYQMQANGETVKFYWMYAEYNQDGSLANAGTDDGGYVKLPANKAYLSLNKSEGATSYSFRFDWDGTTDIEEVVTDENSALDGTIFDLQGRRIVGITEPGLYIIDGKKVFVEEIK